MGTAKEFLQRLNDDQAFANEVAEAIKEKREAGATNYYETIIPVAAERGYEVTEDDLDKMNDIQSEVLNDEELGKVAGGTSCLGALATFAIFTAASAVNYSIYKLLETLQD